MLQRREAAEAKGRSVILRFCFFVIGFDAVDLALLAGEGRAVVVVVFWLHRGECERKIENIEKKIVL